jgi:hypothetical protein
MHVSTQTKDTRANTVEWYDLTVLTSILGTVYVHLNRTCTK